MNTEGQTEFNGNPQGCECINKDSSYIITLPCTHILRSGVYSHLIHVNVLHIKTRNFESVSAHSRHSHLSYTTYLGTPTFEQDSFLPQSWRQLGFFNNFKFYYHEKHWIWNSHRKSNKMQQCIKFVFHIYMKLNMFWATLAIIRSLKLH
jgi:hypothetical protein